MRICEYDAVDALQVLQLSMLALDFPLTPERLAHTFPGFTLHALEDDVVLGQLGVLRHTLRSTEGNEEVGELWGLATHPEHAARGVASSLLQEAHRRMRAAGLQFSILRADRFAEACRLYLSHGYQDMHVRGTGMACWETAHQPTRLRAQPLDAGDPGCIEPLVEAIAAGSLGFAWSSPPLARPGGPLSLETVRVLYENQNPVGYISTRRHDTLLRVTVHALVPGVDAAEAVAAITSEETCSYVQVMVSRPAEIASLRAAGYQVTHPDRMAFLLKPLGSGLSHEDACRLFGIGTDRFLISWLDMT